MPRFSTTDPTIGDAIKLRRQARRWSIRFAADRAGISHTTWSRIERKVIGADNRFVLAAIAGALQCPVADLTQAPAAPANREAVAVQAAVHAVLLTLVETDLDDPPTCIPRPWPEVAADAALIWDLSVRADYAGAATMLPRVLRELHAYTHAGEPDRSQALRLLIRTVHWTSSLVRGVGHRGEAWVAAKMAGAAAQALGDPVMTGMATFTQAHAAISAGSYARGLSLAERGANDLDRHAGLSDAVEVMGMLHLTCAFSAAGVGGDPTDRLAEAGQLAARAGETTTLDLMFGPTNVDVWRVSMLADGRDPGAAAVIAAGVTPALMPSTNRQAVFFVDYGRALAHSRRAADALKMLLVAERLAPQLVHSSRIVQETGRSLAGRVAGAELRGFCERLGVSV